MSALRIVPVDPDDADQLARWHDVDRRGAEHGRSTYLPNRLEAVRALLDDSRGAFRYRAHLGSVGDEPVVAGWSAYGRRDNPDHGWLWPRVPPEHRRRGHGTAMLAVLEGDARSNGRRILNTSAYGAPGEEDSCGTRFAERHGYRCGLVEVKRRLDLPVADALLEELGAEAAVRHAGYRIRTFSGPVPDDLVEQWAEISAALATEAPSGDLEATVETPSVAAIREEEAELAESGERKLQSVALDRDGRIAAYSDLVVRVGSPDPATHWGTLVRTAHRGRRLGLAVKVAGLRLLADERPDVPAVVTETAADNAHMIAINDRLGFRPMEWRGDYQRRLDR